MTIGLEEGMRKGKAEGKAEDKAEGLITGALLQPEASERSMNQCVMNQEGIAEIVGMIPLKANALLMKS